MRIFATHVPSYRKNELLTPPHVVTNFGKRPPRNSDTTNACMPNEQRKRVGRVEIKRYKPSMFNKIIETIKVLSIIKEINVYIINIIIKSIYV